VEVYDLPIQGQVLLLPLWVQKNDGDFLLSTLSTRQVNVSQKQTLSNLCQLTIILTRLKEVCDNKAVKNMMHHASGFRCNIQNDYDS